MTADYPCTDTSLSNGHLCTIDIALFATLTRLLGSVCLHRASHPFRKQTSIVPRTINTNRRRRRTSLLERNCMVISSSTFVVAVLMPGGSLATSPNFRHFFEHQTMHCTVFIATLLYLAFGNDRKDFHLLISVGLCCLHKQSLRVDQNEPGEGNNTL